MKELILKVKDIIQETEDTITIVFDTRDLVYEAGQYLMLKVIYEDDILFRAYSLCTSPFVDEFPAITVKRVYKGKISNFLNSNLKIGDTISSYYPKGKFTTKYDIDNKRHVVCIAAGSGITPLYAIMKSTLYKELNSYVSLVYINRNEDSIIFKQNLESLKENFPNRFNIISILTRPNLPINKINKHINWSAISGRPDNIAFSNLLGALKAQHLSSQIFEYYLCGPQNMMDNAINALKCLNTNDKDIFYESFGSSTNNKTEVLPSSTPKVQKEHENSKVTIIYEGNTYNLSIPKTQTILEAALDEDIDLPFACSSGTCNVCMAKCNKGNVEMECDDGLTEEEINNKFILTCVSRPKSDEVEIEIPKDAW